MVLYGHVIRVRDAITAAMILSPEHHTADDPAVLAAECLAAVDPGLPDRVREGDILVAGADLGGGAGQEVAVLALQAAGFAAVVCASADHGFAAEARGLGLPLMEQPEAAAALPDGGLVRVDLATGRIEERATGAVYQAQPAPPEVVAATRQRQLLARMRRVVEEEGFDG